MEQTLADEQPPVDPNSKDLLHADLQIVTQFQEEGDGALTIQAGEIMGWALTDEPLVLLEALLGGTVAGAAALGLDRPDIARLYPDLPHAREAGFRILLRRGRLPQGVRHALLRGRTRGGRQIEAEVPLTFAADPSQASSPIRMHLEQCRIDEGVLLISGWALAKAKVLTVQVFDGDDLLGAAITALPRPDVAADNPDWPDSQQAGFKSSIQLSAPQIAALTSVRVEVTARDGATRWLVQPTDSEDTAAPTPATAPAPRSRSLQFAPAPAQPVVPIPAPPTALPQNLHFHPDVALLLTTGLLRLSGWALAAEGISRIVVKLGGETVAETRPSLPRPDVAQAYPTMRGAANSGFQLQGDLPGPVEGEVTLSIRIERPGLEPIEFPLSLVATEPTDLGADPNYAPVRVAVDDMKIDGGHSRRLLTGSFHLVGWAVAPSGIDRVEVELDGTAIGRAYVGLRREDIAEAFPEIEGALRGGFGMAIPGRLLRNGRSEFRIRAFDIDGVEAEISFTVDIDKQVSATGTEALRRHVPYSEVRTLLGALRYRGSANTEFPVCDLVLRMQAGRKGTEAAIRTLLSLASQAYPAWRVWIKLNVKNPMAVVEVLRSALPEHAHRLRPVEEASLLEDGSLAGVLAAGDLLAADSLLRLVSLAFVTGEADFVYGDDRRPTPGGTDLQAFFKPDWSADLLMEQNYIGRAWLARADLLARAKLSLQALGRFGDYKAVLRLTAAASRIAHLSRVTLEAPTQDSPESERQMLTDFLPWAGIKASVERGAAPFLHRLRRPPGRPGCVSIIIPSIGAHGHVVRCLESLRRFTTGCEIETIIVDNIREGALSDEQRSIKAWFAANADVVVPVDEPFNWSRLNNLGAAAARGEYMLFLNDDVEALEDGWLPTLLAEASRPEVGLVGPQLLYPDGKVQHAGLYLSRSDLGSGRHAFRFAAADEPGYFGLALSTRNVSCVTGACMLLRREVFERVNGFDEAHSVINNDVDFSLRVFAKGLRVLYVPHASLRHHELASRANIKDEYDRSAFLDAWQDFCEEGDPFHSPHLSPEAEELTPDEEPLREVFAGHPLGNRAEVRRILALKVDHIGDLVTGLPAFRRLKAHFPHAKLTAMVGKSAIGIAQMEGAIDDLIPFEFFDARSGLGQKVLTEEDYAALSAKLHAERFDLAVDLRKALDTRHLLQYSGAPVLAGYDHDQRFPWLDIALEWERDPKQANKRSHVSDDLLNLVDAVANAYGEDRLTIQPLGELPPLSAELGVLFEGILNGRYAVMHPGSGTPTRQWPAASFARLADLLIERDGIPVVLLGGPDEREIADAVLSSVRRTDMVVDLIGRSRLTEVPRIMAGAALFVGNNSGPSHVAAGLGVPTVSVHSGVIASEEWGPMGPDALAIRRDMTCAPCYIATVAQCHRKMACLTRISPFAVHDACRRLLALGRGGMDRTAIIELQAEA